MPKDCPSITVFGSCRVYTPCQMLAKEGRFRLSQGKIFGFAHYTSEILQQINIVTGRASFRNSLRPYLNIPPSWHQPDVNVLVSEMFVETDLFVVEISSVRQVLFKSLFLQINRTQEKLVQNDEILRKWWNPLARTGVNDIDLYRTLASPEPLQMEVASGLKMTEQSVEAIRKDAEHIEQALGKPVLFVSHFDTDYQGASIPQRKRIIDALSGLGGGAFFDPTPAVRSAGLKTAIKDLGHYTSEFEREIGFMLKDKIAATL